MNKPDGEKHGKVFDELEGIFEKLPEVLFNRVKKDLEVMKEIFIESRPARVLIIGRRGAGKSSLVNALVGEKVAEVGSVVSETGKASWHTVSNGNGEVEIIDTRGIGDATKPASSEFDSSLEELKAEVEKKCPDVIIFVCKAKEVDAHLSEDIHAIEKIRSLASKQHAAEIPVMSCVTQVDELDPRKVNLGVDDCKSEKYIKKENNVNQACEVIRKQFDEKSVSLIEVVPVSAYAEYDEDGGVEDSDFWNIEYLKEKIIDVLPYCAQLQQARADKLKNMQKRLARKVIHTTAGTCSAIAVTPIPFADVTPIVALQVAMICGIGKIGGREFSKENAREFLVAMGANVGAGFALRESARTIAKYIPGVGSVVSGSVAFFGTKAIGEAAIAYYIDEVSEEVARSIFNKKKDEERDNEVG
ncbi:GTPase [Chromohalobacter sp. 296-RDG]|uniref:GTPase family protein n=1 Tax=Chromohalobacter sp. 296-RDG TaxID=2994062 RepID=UPI0024693383|nr:GTPase [Chromohalobacter sp. 296-RDG]